MDGGDDRGVVDDREVGMPELSLDRERPLLRKSDLNAERAPVILASPERLQAQRIAREAKAIAGEPFPANEVAVAPRA